MAGGNARAIIAIDSNFLVAARRIGSTEGERLEHWLEDGSIIHVSAIAWSEYFCGPLRSDEIVITRSFITSIDPFTKKEAELAGELFDQSGRRSRSHADCMIAAHAILQSARLATLNLRDFRRFEKFQLRLA